jgi:putative mRNA 3-end processing factor
MKVKFLGGAQEVGRLGILVETDGGKILFDYGMTATDPPSLPMQSPRVDALFLTHSHLDHCGMIPWLCDRYEDVPVYCTPVTQDVSTLLMNDSIKVAQAEGYPEPYDAGAVRRTMRSFRAIDFNDVTSVIGLEVATHSAGHIPGAAMYELNGSRNTLITGDYHTLNQRIVWGAEPVKCDDLIMESTYAGREHPDRQKTERDFLGKITEVVDRGGMAIVPSFAVARMQELMLLLRDTDFDYWMDGMGKTVTRMYLDHPEYLRSPKKLANADKRGHVVKNPKMKDQALNGEVIVTTSGMLDGGPVLSYLEKFKDDPKSAVLLTGYQVEGTNGRRLVDTGMIDFYGQLQKIACEVKSYDFSAHAGHSELIEFVKGCSPERVVLMHGDDRELLAEPLRKEGFEVITPVNGKSFDL